MKKRAVAARRGFMSGSWSMTGFICPMQACDGVPRQRAMLRRLRPWPEARLMRRFQGQLQLSRESWNFRRTQTNSKKTTYDTLSLTFLTPCCTGIRSFRKHFTGIVSVGNEVA